MSETVPVLGSKGQQLCDGCRRCRLGYHCSACGRAWRKRAASRSQIRSHRNRERRRAREAWL